MKTTVTAPAPVVPTPQFYTVDDLARILRDDFAFRGTIATVDVDEWGPEKMRGEPIVIISLGDGELSSPGGARPIGAWWQNPGGSTDVSRAIFDDSQEFVLRIHAPNASQAETAGEGGRRATDQLMRQTVRAIRRRLAGNLRDVASYEWPGKNDPDVLGYGDFTYGSLCRVRLTLVSPVLDDALHIASPVTQMSTEIDFSTDGDTFTQSDTFTNPISLEVPF